MDSFLTTFPQISLDERLNSVNIFNTLFGHQNVDEWINTLIRSIDEPVIEGLQFPSFPPKEIQSLVHGNFGDRAILEAGNFYRIISSLGLTGPSAPWYMKGYLLDFGSGWGRIVRLFMRDFPLRNIFGYEPDTRFCITARNLNPYIAFYNGEHMPSGGILPRRLFNLIVSFSVFSHLSIMCAEVWLRELSDILVSGGAMVLTTWGARFLHRLKHEKEKMQNGEEIHWYSKYCIERFGDLDSAILRYSRGEFVWFPGHRDLYGESFISEKAMRIIIERHRLPLEIVLFNDTDLSQAFFVIKKH